MELRCLLGVLRTDAIELEGLDDPHGPLGPGNGGTGTGQRVVVADDHALARGGFRMILKAQPDMEVTGEAANGLEAAELARSLAPDIALMDARMPGLGGIEATRRVTAASVEGPRALMLTTFDLDEYVYQAIRAGASGFLLKDVRPAELVHAVSIVSSAGTLLAPAITRRLMEEFVRRPLPGRCPASARPSPAS